MAASSHSMNCPSSSRARISNSGLAMPCRTRYSYCSSAVLSSRLAGSRHTEPSGAVSVIPHAWTTVRPWRSNPSSIDRGTAAPPTTNRSSADRSHRPGSASIAASIPIHTVGTPAVIVTRSSASRSSTLSGVEMRPRAGPAALRTMAAA